MEIVSDDIFYGIDNQLDMMFGSDVYIYICIYIYIIYTHKCDHVGVWDGTDHTLKIKHYIPFGNSMPSHAVLR